jgi:hypothetical protein
MSDYRRFLGAHEVATLPYFGGPYVEAPDRRLRISRQPGREPGQGSDQARRERPPTPGFWRFEISGRDARPVAPAPPPDLGHLPAVRGHLAAGYVFASGGTTAGGAVSGVAGAGAAAGGAESLALDAEYEPPRFSPVTARRWPSGELLLDTLDFEGEAEEPARRAYEEGRDIGALRGVPASLRAAFGYAVLLRLAGERGVAVAPAEVRGRLAAVADGREDPVQTLSRLLAERARRAATARPGAPDGRAAAARPASGPATGRAPGWVAGAGDRSRPEDPQERAAEALVSAGATILDVRRPQPELVEVRYRFGGERFVSVADARTLQVVDAGICLAGSDRMVTLDSLPSVIREAMRDGELVITRWV